MLQKRSIALSPPVTLTQVADRSREAVRAFLGLTPSKTALADWLRGPYYEATRFGPRRLVTSSAEVARPELAGTSAIVAGAQDEVRAAVREAMEARSAADLVRRLPPVVHVVRAHDASGTCGFIPIDARGGRLADRVVALVLADYLTRPTDFVASRILPDAPTSSGARRTSYGAPTLPQMTATRSSSK